MKGSPKKKVQVDNKGIKIFIFANNKINSDKKKHIFFLPPIVHVKNT